MANVDMGELEKYWKFGEGSLRVRWKSSGDWTRCQRLLTKHVGSERAKRICAQWHYDMNGGIWPGDKRNK